jgi:ABC-type branched-subunit amino acid transport system ATPase component
MITYRLRTLAEMTVFERICNTTLALAHVLDALFSRCRMERESREALFRAKQILEKS